MARASAATGGGAAAAAAARAASERKPAPPGVSFCCLGNTAEEVAAEAVERIVEKGGNDLFKKYLAKRKFTFSVEETLEAVVSHLCMCFVSHDEQDAARDWALEMEPVAPGVDSFSAFQLEIRNERPWHSLGKGPVGPVAGAPGGISRRQLQRRKRDYPASKSSPRESQTASNISGDPKGSRMGGRSGVESEARSWKIQDEFDHIDRVEESLRRQLKDAEEAARKQKELESAPPTAEEEKEDREKQRRLEELDRRPHTFDSQGRVIWVDPPAVERLPGLESALEWKSPSHSPSVVDAVALSAAPVVVQQQRPTTAPAGTGAAAAKAKGKKKGGAKAGNGSEQAAEVFTDGCRRFEGAQPPLLQIMEVKPGVVLDVNGRTKAGLSLRENDHRMSWKEYEAMVMKETGARGWQRPGTAPADIGPEPSVPQQRPRGTTRFAPGLDGDGSPTAAAAAAAAGGAGIAALEATRKRRAAMAEAGAGDTAEEAQGSAPAPQAPAAPPSMKRAQSAGASRQPQPRTRRPALLGSPVGSGSTSTPQPPLGATMGHGLPCSGGQDKDAYFFPEGGRASPGASPLSRARSAATLRGAAGGTGRPLTAGAGGHASRPSSNSGSRG